MIISITNFKHILFWILMIFPFIPINYITSTYPYMTTVYAAWRYAVIILMVFENILLRRRFRFPVVMSWILVIAATISSLLYGVSFERVFAYSVFLVGFTLVVDNGMNGDCISFIRAMFLFFGSLILLNYVFMIKHPDGYALEHGIRMYLFGSYNTTLRKLIPGLFAGLVYSFYKKGRLTWWFCTLYVLLLLFCIHVWSVTSAVGLIVFACAFLIPYITNKKGIFRYHYFLIGSVVVSLIFAILQNFQEIKIIEFLITNIFKKDMTLSSRTSVWSSTMAMIAERPVWGYGQIDGEINRKILGAAAAHNIYLDELYYGGVIGLILLIIIIFVVGKKLYNAEIDNNMSFLIAEAIFCSYFVMWNFEPFADINSFYVMYAMFTIAYYCNNFQDHGITRKRLFKK